VLLDDEIFAMLAGTNARNSASRLTALILVPVNSSQTNVHAVDRDEYHPCYGPDFIIVNSCLDCGNVWLDCRELTHASCLTS